MNKKLGLKIFIGCTLFFYFFIIYQFLLKPKIDIIGDEVIFVTVNDNYIELGGKASTVNKDITSQIAILGKVDTSKLGTYQVTYEVKANKLKATKTRTIKVIDDIKPIISLTEGEIFSMCPNQVYIEPGYSAVDNLDGDITDRVKVTTNENEIIYQVTDNSDNEVIMRRQIIKEDIEKPTITLKGNQTVTIVIGSKYIESGYTAFDHCDGTLTDKVKVTNNININKTGTYYVTYEVSDTSNNITTISRTIKVINKPTPKDIIIYLTFDDGPSNVTPLVLDILKEENVKATFFVLDRSSSYNYLLQRIVTEGHTIALHTATHEYSKIYKSVTAFFTDLDIIKNKVYNITGIDSKIMRFPGGSSNTVSRHYNMGIMSVLTKEVGNRGYLYYDWNVSSGDTDNITSSQIYTNVINNIGTNPTQIVLFHDFANNYKTVNALKDIISYCKNKGYKFDRITENTPQIKHKVNN